MNHAWRQAYQDLHGIWGLVERIDFAAKEAEARTLAHGIALNILNIAASIDRSRWQNAYVEFIGFQLNDPSRVWERLMDRHGGDEFIRTKNCVHNLLALAFAHSHLGEQAIKVAARQVERLEKKEDGVIGVTDFDREDIVIALYIRGVARLIVQPGGDRSRAQRARDDAGATQLATQAFGVGQHESLGGAVRRLPGCGVKARQRRHVEHRPAATLHHSR